MKILDLGIVEYQEAHKIQKDVLEKRKNGRIPDTLIVAEHPAVFTIGRTGSYDNLLVDKDVLTGKSIKIIEVDRGGDITFHGPGQIVLYPIMNIKKRALDVHSYIRKLEEVMKSFLRDYGINGRRIQDKSGIWVEDKKIGFVGIGISRWTSSHGISLNINTELAYFSMIRSCGISGIETTSMEKILGKKIDMDESKKKIVSVFERIFEQSYEKIPAMA